MLFRKPSLVAGKDRPPAEQPAPKNARPNELRAPGDDPLAASLTYLAGYHGRAVSREALLGGLPILNGRLSVALYDRAARRAGLGNRSHQAGAARYPCAGAPCRPDHEERHGAHSARHRPGQNKSAKVLDPAGQAGHGRRFGRSRAIAAQYTGYAFLVRAAAGSRCAHGRRRRPSAKSLVLVGRQGALAQLRAHCAGRLPDQHAGAGDAACSP